VQRIVFGELKNVIPIGEQPYRASRGNLLFEQFQACLGGHPMLLNAVIIIDD
jgi:hypothetical protein